MRNVPRIQSATVAAASSSESARTTVNTVRFMLAEILPRAAVWTAAATAADGVRDAAGGKKEKSRRRGFGDCRQRCRRACAGGERGALNADVEIDDAVI